MRNLVENAQKYGAPPVEVEVSTGAETVSLTVADHGTGIPDADLDHIFEPFYRAKGSQNVDGYGLGLALVSRIVEMHGGSLAVSNRTGGGAVFTAVLPSRPAHIRD